MRASQFIASETLDRGWLGGHRLLVLRVASACTLAALLWPAPVRAYEDQRTLGVGLGYAQAVADAGLGHAIALDLTASTGLSAEWTLRGRLTYALAPRRDLEHRLIGAVELLYVIDILELVPYFGVGGAGLLRVERDEVEAVPAPALIAGLDYLWSRSLTVELDVRGHALLSSLSSEPLYWVATLSSVWMFDD